MVQYVPILDRGGRRRSLLIQGLLFLIFFVVVALIVFGVGYSYVKEDSRSRDNAAVYNIEIDDNVDPLDTSNIDLYLDVNVADVNPGANSVKLTSRVIRVSNTPRMRNTTLLLGSFKTVAFSNTTLYADQDSTLWAEGDVGRYPFDHYEAEAPFAATTGSIFAMVAGNSTADVNFGIIVYSGQQNWRCEMEFKPLDGTEIVMLTIKIKRAPSTIGFSVFVIVLLWVITFAVVCLTFHILIRRREVVPPIIAIYVALLFAMPAVRNIQPNIPPIGTLTDTIGLFWNMVIVALCGVTIMFRWILQAKVPSPPEEQPAQPADKQA